MSDELIKVVNFDGFISHVGDSGEGSEVIIYVAHVVSDDSRLQERGEVGAAQNLFGCENHVNNDDDFGTMFTIRVGQCVERVAAKNISENERLAKVRLIDKGIDVEVERNTLFPSTSRARLNTDCMCPVLVIDAGEEQREVAAQIIGRGCRCINGNLVVIPSVGLCVKGRLLISYGNGGYVELKDIRLVRAEGQECSNFIMEDMPQLSSDVSPLPEHEKPFRYHCDSIACRRNVFGNDGGRYEREECSSVVNICGNEAHTFDGSRFTNRWNNDQFGENSSVIGSSTRVHPRSHEKSYLRAKFSCDRKEMDDMYTMVSGPNVPYKQHAFKEYVPHIYPRTVRIRFDKIDSSSAGTFWVFEPNIFTTVERILHEGRQRYSSCPQFDISFIHELSGVGCLVKTNVDSGCRSLCRAEIVKFATRTYRFSVYLVDYGFCKWVKCSDVFDISGINKRDKIIYLPVALLHCRLEEFTNGLCLQQLEKGGEYEITIKSRDSVGIFNVHVDRIDNEGALANIRDSIVPFNNSSFLTPWCSCSSLQYTTNALAKVFHNMVAARGNSFLSTMMRNNMPFNGWPSICGFGIPYPMIMPLMMPTVPNFGDIINKDQGNRMIAHLDRGDDARSGESFSVNKSVRSFTRKSNGRFWGHEESSYRAVERSGNFNCNDSFDEHCGFRRNGFWNRRREKNGGGRSHRPRKCGHHINTAGSDEAQENFSFVSSEFANLSEGDGTGEAVACQESSEWDLPPVRNQHANRFTDFDKNITGSESKLSF